VLTGFTGPHLPQRQLCPADTFVLSAVLLVFGTLTGVPDQIGAPPAFTGASNRKSLRQTWQVLTGFPGPHLSQRQLYPADTFVLSAVLLVFVTLTGAPDQIGAPPAFTGALNRSGRCWKAFQVLPYHRDNCVPRTLVLSAVLLVFGTLTGAPDQIGAPPAFTGAFRQIWQVMTGFTGPHLWQRQLCHTDTCTLSSPTVLWTKKVLQSPDKTGSPPGSIHLPRSRRTFILVSNNLETMPEPLNHIASP
jgi:hypothetical protein